MRFALRKAKEGFTLIELMIVVAIVGILAVLAIYGVRKYIANAKTAEARNNLGQIAKDASAAYDREKLSINTVLAPGGSTLVLKSLCSSATAPIPNGIASVTGKKYQSTAAEWSSGDPATGWECLKFVINDPQYYMYTYSGTAGTAGSFSVVANGDLNGDGIASTFSIAGSIQAGVVNIAPTISEINPEE